MYRTILTLLLTVCCGIAMAQSGMVLNGDFDRDGKITTSDVSRLASICIAKNNMVAGVIEDGIISLRDVSQYTPSTTSFLMGDIDGDGRITIFDVTQLILQLTHPEQYHYAAIRDGKIVQGYLIGQMFIRIGEDEFIDDGEEELLTSH